MQRTINKADLPVISPFPQQQAAQTPLKPQPQSPSPQMQGPGAGDYFKSAAKLFGQSDKFLGYFGGSSAVSGAASGAASGAVSASGGTYVTGSGLAGSASPIHLAGSSAAKGGFSGVSSGLKGGLTTAGIGVAAGFLGDKIFGGEGGTGASIGATIGTAVLPGIGTVVGGLLGGAVGGLFGGGSKRSYYSMGFGDKGMSSMDVGTVYDTALGGIKIWGKRDGGKAVSPALDAIRKSDEQVAALFDEDQLVRVKQGIADANFKESTKWTQNPQRAETVFKNTAKARYASAVSGLDEYYGGVFNRLANEKNMGDLISTLATIDRDHRSGQNIFAGKEVANGEQAIDIIAQTYGLADEKPAMGSMTTQRPTEIPKPEGGPQWVGLGKSATTPGWTYQRGGMGLNAGWVPSRGSLGGSGSYQQVLGQLQGQWDNEKKKIDEANSKALGAWERQVINAYLRGRQILYGYERNDQSTNNGSVNAGPSGAFGLNIQRKGLLSQAGVE